jgi:hypothetical protein
MSQMSGGVPPDGATAIREEGAPRPTYERSSPGDLLGDRHRIVALVGKGGMGGSS